MIVKFAMQCGHSRMAPLADIQERMQCNVCKRYRKVKAIESREWYFKCGGCRYARFTGQNKQEAKTLLGIHHINTHHTNGDVYYRRHPEKSAAIRRMWGRKVRDVLIPEKNIYPDEKLPLKMMKRDIEEVMLPEKPPF